MRSTRVTACPDSTVVDVSTGTRMTTAASIVRSVAASVARPLSTLISRLLTGARKIATAPETVMISRKGRNSQIARTRTITRNARSVKNSGPRSRGISASAWVIDSLDAQHIASPEAGRDRRRATGAAQRASEYTVIRPSVKPTSAARPRRAARGIVTVMKRMRVATGSVFCRMTPTSNNAARTATRSLNRVVSRKLNRPPCRDRRPSPYTSGATITAPPAHPIDCAE